MPPAQRSSRSKDSLEVRRARGEVSCAECRRHKLKCNKAIPCSTCIRKGCQAICPNGTLPPGHGRQDSDIRMDKFVQMSKRIQQLEDALQMSHSSICPVPHPLLAEDLLRIKNIIERPYNVKKEGDASDEDTTESCGTSTMVGRGMGSYVGPDKCVLDHFGSWEAMLLRLYPTGFSPASYPSDTFPFAPLSVQAQEIQVFIEERLPGIERASALIEAYLENISWLMRIVDREQITEELIPDVYRRRRVPGSNAPNKTRTTEPHTLSLLLAVFAFGAVADLTLSPWNEEANLYYHLSWAAISLRPVFDGPSLHTVQTLALLGSYDIFSCQKNSLECTWKLISFCLSLASSIGLHRDPAHFNLTPKLIQRRRQVFWELHSSDIWRSIGSGRPLMFVSSAVDCELPEDREARINEDGIRIPSLWGIRYRYSKEVMADLVEKLGSARALKYSEILSLDQKIRDFDPDRLSSQTSNAEVNQDGSTQSVLTKFLLALLKDASLLLLHRNFFVRALIENPRDPMQCQFAPSFLSTYRSATTILRVLREMMKTSSQLLVRIWPIWAHALSASVMLGSVAACGSSSALAPQAYVEFNLSIEMLTKVQMHPIVKDLLPVMLRLRDKAYQSLTRHSNEVPLHRPTIVNRPPAKEEEKEFSAVSGLGRILQKSLESQSGDTQGFISSLLDKKINQSATPSATAVASPRPPESVYRAQEFLHGGTTPFLGDGEQDMFKSSHESPATGSFSQPPSQSAIATTGLFHPSFDSQTALKHLQYGSGETGVFHSGETDAFHLPSDLHTNIRSDNPWECSPANTHQGINGQDHDALYGMNTKHHAGSEGFNGLPTSSNASFEGITASPRRSFEHTETRMDAPQSPLNFDALSALSPTSLFNTDFDVSFDMRASTGDESVLPLISDDLAAWRTILGDSRFFGVDDAAPDTEAQPDLF